MYCQLLIWVLAGSTGLCHVQRLRCGMQARGEARRGVAALHGAAAVGPGPDQAPAFKAAPAPPSTRAPAPLPPLQERPVTEAAPFRLRSEARHAHVRTVTAALTFEAAD